MALVGPQEVRRAQIKERDVGTETSQKLVNGRPRGRVIPLRVVLGEVDAERRAHIERLARVPILFKLFRVAVGQRLREAGYRVVRFDPFHAPARIHSELVIVKHVVAEIVGHSHDVVADLVPLHLREHEALNLKRGVKLVIVVDVGLLGEKLRHGLGRHGELVQDVPYFLGRHAISLSSDMG